MEALEKRYRYNKKFTSAFAADVNVTNCGGTIMWIGDLDDMFDRVQCQEEISLDKLHGFSRVMSKKIYYSRKGPYVMHNGRRFYFGDFYMRW